MSFTKRVTAALLVAATILSSQASAQVSITAMARIAPAKLKYNQGQDNLIGLVPNYTYHAVYGEYSYNGQNMVFAGLENGGSAIKVFDAATPATTTTPISSLGVLAGNNTIRVTISNSGRDVAATGITVLNQDLIFISSDSGLNWLSTPIPSVTSGNLTYDTLVTTTTGHSFGIYDVDFQPSFFYGLDGKLYGYTYQQASGATSDTDRIALVEHVFTPGNLTPVSRVIFTVTIGSNCSNTFGRICYINAVPTDSGVLLIEGAGAFWSPPFPYPGRYAPRYAFVPYGSTGTVNSWGFVGDGSSSGVSLESIDQDEIAIAYMGVNPQGQEVAFLRRKGNTTWGPNYAVSKLTLVDSGGVHSFSDTHPYPGQPYTSLNSAHLAAATIGTTDLASLLGIGTRPVRDIAANRYSGNVSVFLYGPPHATTGVMELDDVTTVKFAPGNAVTPGMRQYVNDYLASQAASAGKILDTNPIGFDVSSRPDGKIATFFTGSLIPNPTNPHQGKIFYQVW